jgi:cytochrome c-type protein NapB
MFLSGVIAIAAVGYFVGINDGVPHQDVEPGTESWLTPYSEGETETQHTSSAAITALRYSEMRRAETGPTSHWKPTLDQIPQPVHDL